MFKDEEERAIRFAEMVRASAEEKVECEFRERKNVTYPVTGVDVCGYFVDTPYPKLAVATGKSAEEWLPVVIHESCHMDQYLQQAACWEERLVPGTRIEAVELLMLWTQGKIELSREQLRDFIARVRNVELDCEMRAVKKIRQGNLPISIPEYIKKANSHIYLFTMLSCSRHWYIPGREPYVVKEVWSLAPEEFRAKKAYEHIPRQLRMAFHSIIMPCCSE